MPDSEAKLYSIEISFAELVSPKALKESTVKNYNVTENIIVLEIPGT